MLQLCRGVVALHARGMGKIHRDIKPDNIMVVEERRPEVKLMDFGVIKDLGRPTITEMHEFLGTVRYAAPESILGKVQQPKSHQELLDLYSMGAVFCDLINGFPLFPEVRSRFQIAVLKTQYEPPIVRDDIPVSFITIARGLIAIQPENRRPITARALLEIVEALDVSESPKSIEEDLERRIQKFDVYRAVHKQQLLSDKLATGKLESIRDETFSMIKELQMALEERLRTEETLQHDNLEVVKRSDVKKGQLALWASFGICADEANGIFFPMTISVSALFSAGLDITLWMAGFYDSIYYQRRAMQKLGYDSLWAEIKGAWDHLCRSTFSDADNVYQGIYDRRAIGERLKGSLMKVVDRFLVVNEFEIFARQKGYRLAFYRVNKITQHGEILHQETRWAFHANPGCLVSACDSKRARGDLLCTLHKAQLLPAAEGWIPPPR